MFYELQFTKLYKITVMHTDSSKKFMVSTSIFLIAENNYIYFSTTSPFRCLFKINDIYYLKPSVIPIIPLYM
jgi:hypothetical protein